ncbi:TRAP transporter large permease [Leucobacter chinensis]|uniref:TRAP transporter large permease n=1 Tax=Leucobacter chinensis TaxID=2851010 RepID=UPI001C22C93B|nr:TRAP transporter large permease [Leucobacter chinensis]
MLELVLFGTFLVLLFLGVPVAFSMGVSALAAVTFKSGMIALAPMTGVFYASLSGETLLAIPFFILAGVIMELTGISKRLIEFADALVGHKKGGIALTTVITALLFSAVSGSGPATVAAIGTILIPALVSYGYSKRHAASLVASAGEIGIILPPSIAYIVFAVIAQDYERVSIGRLFMAGVVPGILLGVTLYIVTKFLPREYSDVAENAKAHIRKATGRLTGPEKVATANATAGSANTTAGVGSVEKIDFSGTKTEVINQMGADVSLAEASREEEVSTTFITQALSQQRRTERAPWPVIGRAFLRALPGLLVPVIILGGIYGGIFTPTESAAVAVIYALLVGFFVSRDLKLKNLRLIFTASGLQASRIMFIIGSASLFAYVLTRFKIADHIAGSLLQVTSNPILIILMVNLILLIAGMFLDAISAFYLFIPIVVPLLLEVGMDITTIGVMMTLNLAIGLITPPVGLDLFVAAGIAKISFAEASKGIVPFLLSGIAFLLLVAFVPMISNFLPDLLELIGAQSADGTVMVNGVEMTGSFFKDLGSMTAAYFTK